MEINGQSSPGQNDETKAAAFRKPSADTVNRKYRRRSPVGGSFSPEGTLNRERSSSPIASRKDPSKTSDDLRKKHHQEDLDQDSSKSAFSRNEYERNPGRESSRSSRSYRRYDDYNRNDKHADDIDRDYAKSSSRSHRDSKANSYSDYTRHDEHRSRDYYHSDGYRHKNRDKEKDLPFNRGGSGRRDKHENRFYRDEKTDKRSSHDSKGNYEDSRGFWTDSTSRRESSGHPLKEPSLSDTKESDAGKYTKEEKGKYDEQNRYKERHFRETVEKFEHGKALSTRDSESPAKKPKMFSLDRGNTNGEDGNESESSNSKRTQDPACKLTSGSDYLKDSDIDAAKIAAMRAAELVNKNLIGTGYMSTEQKKKLLWGSKKSTPAAEEPTHHWDTSMFGDRERQEKFNKLMSLRLPWYIWPIVGFEGRGKVGEQTGQPRRRKAEGTADGFREAIHCWTSPKRRAHSWSWSLRLCANCLWTYITVFRTFCLYLFRFSASLAIFYVSPAISFMNIYSSFVHFRNCVSLSLAEYPFRFLFIAEHSASSHRQEDLAPRCWLSAGRAVPPGL